MISTATLTQDLERIRSTAPLVHNITNHVVMNLTANALLAIGASPVMAHAREEVEEMTALAGALVLNIGTLSPAWVEAMELAAGAAARKGIPVVLDPVGAGATRYRTETSQRLLADHRIAILRGNASEIRAVAALPSVTKGVDAAHEVDAAREAALRLAERHGCAVVVSGAEDLIVGDGREVRIANGTPLFRRVTGTGCTAAALVGAFAAVDPDTVAAAAHAMAAMGVAGELAAEGAVGPADFQVRFLDRLASLDGAAIEARLRLGSP